ncbi:uncharacterized protein TM35_000431270 [Trypanosoma theileri]|uniref:Uncharacterized protein n=1 Tax=Trypanosoma theileri TaxID=67003 RepID=A0A1X0NK62_9TRYP|nr:uncharacterized protein TM35_000431270 [Trypanosoma theileri]ORC84559.1 hypothetical protein TM35_000431270 [Trypanosoma theileri]
MSWLVALENVCQRAAARASQRTSLSSSSVVVVAGRLAPPPAAAAAVNRTPAEVAQQASRVVNSIKERREKEKEKVGEVEMKMSSSTAALHHISDTWSGALQVIQFSQLDISTSIEQRMYELPLSLAAESVAILLKAGKGTTAVDLLHSWQHPTRRIQLKSKVIATRHLQRALKTLGVIGDVETLRSVISILHRELLEQKRQLDQQGEKTPISISISTSSSSSSTVREGEGGKLGSSENSTVETCTERRGLFSALGPQRTRLLLVKAVHELIIQDESLVPVYEKLTWINAVTIATMRTMEGKQTSCLIPFELQDDFHRVVERSPLYNAQLLQQIGPAFACGFRQPTQCSPAEILSTPRSEMRRIYTQKAFLSSKDEWTELQQLLLSHSPCIRHACDTTLLLRLLCGRQVRKGDMHLSKNKDKEEEEQRKRLRQYFITQLQSSRSSARRMWSRMLLRHPPLLSQLHLSPLMIFSTCALTFRSFHVHQTFVRCCLPLLRRLRRMGRSVDAARLVWNHLSVVHYTLAVLFSQNPRAFENAVAVVSRTMREGVGGRCEAWMGHRSLALLRAAAAIPTTTISTGISTGITKSKRKGKGKGSRSSNSNNSVPSSIVTPAHCIPICAAALDCGVHFATVQQFVKEMFPNDDNISTWILNMVRLTAKSHVSRVCIPLESASHGAHLRSLLRQYAYVSNAVGSSALVEVCVPSRNKLLAFWSMLNDDKISIPLRRLICRFFLDEINHMATTTRRSMHGKVSSVQEVLHELYREEVLASIASNCTTESSFIICMDALIAQRRLRNAQDGAQLLQLSEMNDNTNIDSTSGGGGGALFSVSG